MSTIEVRGLDELRRIVAGIEPKINAVIHAIAVEIKGKIATYPPQIPGTSYRRTGRLGKNWTTKLGSLSAVIGNITSYGPFVQDREKQATIHTFSGWQTTQDVAEEYDPIVQKRLEAEVQKVLR